METQLFENKNASTEIIGPVVLNLRTGIPYFFSDPSTERHLATVTSSSELHALWPVKHCRVCIAALPDPILLYLVENAKKGRFDYVSF